MSHPLDYTDAAALDLALLQWRLASQVQRWRWQARHAFTDEQAEDFYEALIYCHAGICDAWVCA